MSAFDDPEVLAIAARVAKRWGRESNRGFFGNLAESATRGAKRTGGNLYQVSGNFSEADNQEAILRRRRAKVEDALDPIKTDNVVSEYLNKAASSSVPMAAGIASAALTGPAGPAALFGADAYGDAQGRAMDAGVSRGTAALSALPAGAVGAVSGSLKVGDVLGRGVGGVLGDQVAKRIAPEVMENLGKTLVGRATRYGMKRGLNMFAEGAEEGIEEGGQLVSDLLGEYLSGKSIRDKKMDGQRIWQAFRDGAIVGGIYNTGVDVSKVGGQAALNAVDRVKSERQGAKDAVEYILSNPEAIRDASSPQADAMVDALKSGSVSRKTFREWAKNDGVDIGALGGYAVSAGDRMKIAQIIAEKRNSPVIPDSSQDVADQQNEPAAAPQIEPVAEAQEVPQEVPQEPAPQETQQEPVEPVVEQGGMQPEPVSQIEPVAQQDVAAQEVMNSAEAERPDVPEAGFGEITADDINRDLADEADAVEQKREQRKAVVAEIEAKLTSLRAVKQTKSVRDAVKKTSARLETAKAWLAELPPVVAPEELPKDTSASPFFAALTGTPTGPTSYPHPALAAPAVEGAEVKADAAALLSSAQQQGVAPQPSSQAPVAKQSLTTENPVVNQSLTTGEDRTWEVNPGNAHRYSTHGKISTLSEDHGRVSRELNEAVKAGALPPAHAAVLRTFLAQLPSDVVRGMKFTANEKLSEGAAAAYKEGEIRLRSFPDGMGKTFERALLQNVLHEIGHYAHRRWLTDAERARINELYQSMTRDERIALLSGNQAEPNLTAVYHADSPAEFFAQLFSDYSAGRKIPQTVLEKLEDIFRRVGEFVRRNVENIRNNMQITPEMEDMLNALYNPGGRIMHESDQGKDAEARHPFKADREGYVAKAKQEMAGRKMAQKAPAAGRAARVINRGKPPVAVEEVKPPVAEVKPEVAEVKPEEVAPADTAAPDVQEQEHSPAYHEFAKKMKEAFGYSDKEVAANMALFDALAQRLIRDGKVPDEGAFFERHIAGIEEGGATLSADDGRAIIRALKNPDASSVAHEFAHLMRTVCGRYYQKHLATIESWAGAKNGKWTTEAEEKYARGFERYLRSGKAPTTKLAQAFALFKSILMKIYKNVKGSSIDVEMPLHVRAFFDKILGNEDIASTESDKGFEIWQQALNKALEENVGRESVVRGKFEELRKMLDAPDFVLGKKRSHEAGGGGQARGFLKELERVESSLTKRNIAAEALEASAELSPESAQMLSGWLKAETEEPISIAGDEAGGGQTNEERIYALAQRKMKGGSIRNVSGKNDGGTVDVDALDIYRAAIQKMKLAIAEKEAGGKTVTKDDLQKLSEKMVNDLYSATAKGAVRGDLSADDDRYGANKEGEGVSLLDNYDGHSGEQRKRARIDESPAAGKPSDGPSEYDAAVEYLKSEGKDTDLVEEVAQAWTKRTGKTLAEMPDGYLTEAINRTMSGDLYSNERSGIAKDAGVALEDALKEAKKSAEELSADFAKSIGEAIGLKHGGFRLAYDNRMPFLGRYLSADKGIMIKERGDIETVVHEVFHAMDDILHITGIDSAGGAHPLDGELLRSGQAANVVNRSEGWARFGEMYVLNKEAAALAYPETCKVLEGYSDKSGKHGQLVQALQRAGGIFRAKIGQGDMSQALSNIAGLSPEKKSVVKEAAREALKNGKSSAAVLKLIYELSDMNVGIYDFTDKFCRATGRKLAPDQDPRTLVPLLAGVDGVIADFIDSGIVTEEDGVLVRSKINRDYILEPLDRSGAKAMTEDAAKASAYGVALRVIEEQEYRENAYAKSVQRESGAKSNIKRTLKKLRDSKKAVRAAIKKAGDKKTTPELKAAQAKEKERLSLLQTLRNELRHARKAVKRTQEARDGVIVGWGVTGVSDEVAVARGVIAEIEQDQKQKQRYGEYLSRLREFNNLAVKVAWQSGRITEDYYKQLTDADYCKKNGLFYRKNYIPLNRVMDDVKTSDFGTKGLTDPKAILHKFHGSMRMVENPLLNSWANAAAAIKECRRNEAIRAIVSLATDRNINDGFNGAEHIQSVLETTEGAFPVYFNGEKKFFRVVEPNGANKYLALAVGEFFKANTDPSMLAQLAKIPAKLTRMGVTLSPFYAVRNLIRDSIARRLIGNPDLERKYGAVFDPDVDGNELGLPSGETLESMWRSSGGALDSGFFSKEGERSKLARYMRKAAQDGGLFCTVKELPALYKGALSWGENVNRMKEFKAVYLRARQSGMTDAQARLAGAAASREYLDFARCGKSLTTLRTMIPFLNAQIQGTLATLRACKNDPVGVALKRILPFSIATAALEVIANMLAGDDAYEEWKQLPAWRRNLFMNLYVAPNTFISIPMPQQIFQASSLCSRLLQRITGDEHAFDGFARACAVDWVGTALDPAQISPARSFLEWQANRNFFYNAPIVPAYEENQRVEDRKGAQKASRIGKMLQEISGSDARKFDQFIRTQFGSVGGYAMLASDIGRPDKPTTGTEYAQKITGMVAQTPGYDARDITIAESLAKEAGLTTSGTLEPMRRLLKLAKESDNDSEREKYRLRAIEFAKRVIPGLEARLERAGK